MRAASRARHFQSSGTAALRHARARIHSAAVVIPETEARFFFEKDSSISRKKIPLENWCQQPTPRDDCCGVTCSDSPSSEVAKIYTYMYHTAAFLVVKSSPTRQRGIGSSAAADRAAPQPYV